MKFLWMRSNGRISPSLANGVFPLPSSRTAANEAKQGKKVIVPQRAQEIAEGVIEALGEQENFSRMEAVRGYLNLSISVLIHTLNA